MIIIISTRYVNYGKLYRIQPIIIISIITIIIYIIIIVLRIKLYWQKLFEFD